MDIQAQSKSDQSTLENLEENHARQVIGPFTRALILAIAQLEALWPGDLVRKLEKQVALSNVDMRRFLDANDNIEDILIEQATRGLQAGIDAGKREAVALGIDSEKPFKVSVRPAYERAASKTATKVDERIAMGIKLLRNAETLDDARNALMFAATASNIAAVGSRTITSDAANDGISMVADRHDLVAVLVAERDACVQCLGLQGMKDVDIPVHPNCRCKLMLLNKDETAQPVIDGLKREAERSILRGWSLPSESNKARIDAAKRILDRGSSLPKSVKAYAASAIKRGSFPRGRQFPG